MVDGRGYIFDVNRKECQYLINSMDKELENNWNTKVMPLKMQDGVYNFYLKKPQGQKNWAIDSLSYDQQKINKMVDQAIAAKRRQYGDSWWWNNSGPGFARHPKV